jgi:hypothetical protein
MVDERLTGPWLGHRRWRPCPRVEVGDLPPTTWAASGVGCALRAWPVPREVMGPAPQIVGWPSIFRQPLAVSLLGLVHAILGVRAADLLAGGRIATIPWTSEGMRVTANG